MSKISSQMNRNELDVEISEISDFDDDEIDGLLDASRLNEKFVNYKKSLQSEKETVYDTDEDEEEYDKETDEAIPVKRVTRQREEYSLYEEALRQFFKIVIKMKNNSKKVVIFLILVIINLLIIFSISNNDNQSSQIISINSIQDISRSLTNLQWQINELNTNNKNRLNDFKNYLDLKIDEFNGKFKKLDDRIDDVYSRIDGLSFDNIQIEGNGKMPIILDEYNNVKILPEFESFLQNYINDFLRGENFTNKFKIDFDSIIETHLDKFINSKVGFMRKEEILSLISSQLQENKRQLLQEMKLIQNKSSNIIPPSSKLLNNGYHNPSQNQINYALFSSGARIINYLTSPTFEPKQKNSMLKNILKVFQTSSKDMQTLEDENHQLSTFSSTPFIILTSNEGYWRSSVTKGTKLALKFLEPIYLTSFKYDHSKVINGAAITSAPKKMSVYVDTFNNEKYSRLSEFNDSINGYFKIGEFNYNLNDEMHHDGQGFSIPNWVKKVLIKSIIVKVDDNYGNEFFTSLNKFKIHGMTRFDVFAIKELLNNEEIEDGLKSKFKDWFNEEREFKNKKDAFGEDEVI